MDMDFAIICSLLRHRMPHIRFLSIGSRFCSTLFQKSPRGDPRALGYHFSSIGM